MLIHRVSSMPLSSLNVVYALDLQDSSCSPLLSSWNSNPTMIKLARAKHKISRTRTPSNKLDGNQEQGNTVKNSGSHPNQGFEKNISFSKTTVWVGWVFEETQDGIKDPKSFSEEPSFFFDVETPTYSQRKTWFSRVKSADASPPSKPFNALIYTV